MLPDNCVLFEAAVTVLFMLKILKLLVIQINIFKMLSLMKWFQVGEVCARSVQLYSTATGPKVQYWQLNPYPLPVPVPVASIADADRMQIIRIRLSRFCLQGSGSCLALQTFFFLLFFLLNMIYFYWN